MKSTLCLHDVLLGMEQAIVLAKRDMSGPYKMAYAVVTPVPTMRTLSDHIYLALFPRVAGTPVSLTTTNHLSQSILAQAKQALARRGPRFPSPGLIAGPPDTK